VIRPVFGLPLHKSRQMLRDHLESSEYPWADQHLDYLDTAVVFICVDGEYIAGYMWFFLLEEDNGIWTIHASWDEKYRKKWAYRSVMNTIFAVCYSLGCNHILAESHHNDLLVRMGAEMTDDGAMLKLPYIWR